MKIKHLFLPVTLALMMVHGCTGSDLAPVAVEYLETEFGNVSNEGATLTLDITTEGTWTASSDADWCTLPTKKGSGNGSLTIWVEGNLEASERKATVTISGGTKEAVEIRQHATTGELHYNLPVIFHVLYKDKSDARQYVSQSRLAEILDVVNKLYTANTGSVDMNLSFLLATTDEEGKALDTPGVEYIEWEDDYPINYSEFMADKTNNYVDYLWNPNRYINVMVYNFKGDEDSETSTLGISHLPFTTTGDNLLEGLNEIKYSYLEQSNISFPYCVSINSLYINEQSSSTRYNSADVTVTMAHELGHFLGLHHVFAEDKDGAMNECADTDYCDDTPSYNKTEYDAYVDYMAEKEPQHFTLKNLAKRTDCSGESFTSYNIMDYSFSYSNRFTPQQRARVRHVLTYSPLIPGPKKDVVKTRAEAPEKMDLPIRVVK